ncbi:MAG: hypothetical protein ACJA0Q_001762 [Saprospiraceae bacterium]|jgi:hypothetical protein
MIRCFTKYKTELILILISILIIWPISLLEYTSKWDNLDCFLPYRYFVSYSWSHGHWPFWNPFQQFGYPAYSDTQNGMYNPIVWILSLFGQYDNISLSLELTFYYVLATLGAYKFASIFVQENRTKILIALSFGLSGYFLSNSQILSFIAAAAFLPHILYHLISFFKQNRWIDLLFLVLYTSLHTTAASPAYTIVLCYVFIACFTVYFVLKFQNKLSNFSWIKLLVGVILLVSINAAFINSVWEFLPFMSRAEKLKFSSYMLQNPFDWHEYISFIFPYTTLANSDWFGNTDLTMRSAYIGLFPFVLSIISLKYLKEYKIQMIWGIIALFLILASGSHTPLYQFFYQLPGFGFFRHPALFRIYVILFLSIAAGISFERFQFSAKNNNRVLLTVLIGLVLMTFICWQLRYSSDLNSFLSNWDKSIPPTDHHIRTLLLINLIVISVICLALLIINKRVSNIKNAILILTLIDIGVYSQITSPYTMHQHTTQDAFTNFFTVIPDSINQSVATIPYKYLDQNIDPKQEGLWRNTATFHKILSFKATNPTQFLEFNHIQNNNGLEITKENPLFYDVNKVITLTETTPTESNLLWEWNGEKSIQENKNQLIISEQKILFNGFTVFVKNESPKEDILILNQNYHNLWSATFQQKPLNISKVNQALMGVKIPGNSAGTISYSFNSPKTKVLFPLSILLYILLLALIIAQSKPTLKCSSKTKSSY